MSRANLRLVDLDAQPDGAALLDELRAALVRYIVFPTETAADAVALWIAATHAQPAWEHAPRCAVISPEKRCGKSRLLDVAEATCNRSLVTVNISPAALVRSITNDDPPSLILDEADTVFGAKVKDANEDLRGIINAGHQRNRPYIRWDVAARRNECCPTFAMAMLAGIGNLPDTIMDRAVVVRMRRRAPHETVAPYRTRRDQPALHDLRDRLHAWLAPAIDNLTNAEPDMPIEDRAADTWEPLIAIADHAGGPWPARARRTALAMVAAESETDAEASLGIGLLGDIRDLFDEFAIGFMPSAELANRLRKLDESPWAERDLTTTTLAKMLLPYGVKPGHNSAKTARGYRKDHFADAFARYLPSVPVRGSAQGPDPREQLDGYEPTDGHTRPSEPTRPAVPAGTRARADDRTGTDGQTSGFNPDMWPDGWEVD